MSLDYYIPIDTFQVNIRSILVTDIYPHRINIDTVFQKIEYFFRISSRSPVNYDLTTIFSRYGEIDEEGLLKKRHGSCWIEERGHVLIDGKKINCKMGNFSLWSLSGGHSPAVYSGSATIKIDKPFYEKKISEDKELTRFELMDLE